MKYYTMDWWAGGCDDSNDPIEAYWRYIDQVRAQLPPGLKRLADTNLHDAHLRRLSCSFIHRTVAMEFNVLQIVEPNRSTYRRRVSVVYAGVESIASAADPEVGLGGPHGYGDHGYDEIEVLQPGAYEHRMLFSTGIELVVRFTDVTVEELE